MYGPPSLPHRAARHERRASAAPVPPHILRRPRAPRVYPGGAARMIGAPAPPALVRRAPPRLPMGRVPGEEEEEEEEYWGEGGNEDDEDDEEDGEYDDGPPHFGNGPRPRPDRPSEVVRGVQRRELLSDVVLPWDPRFQKRQEWDPSHDGFVYTGRGEEEREDEETGGFDRNRIARTLETNLDGLFGTNTMTDPEMRRALRATTQATRGGEAVRFSTRGGDAVRLPQDVALKLTRRFLDAERRALDHEEMQVAAGDLDAAVPSPTRSARGTASDPRRIARVFDHETRANDMAHATRFFAESAGAYRALRDSVATANATGRRQYGDYARDLLARVQARIDHAHGDEDEDAHGDGRGHREGRGGEHREGGAAAIVGARVGHAAPHEAMGALRRFREARGGAAADAEGGAGGAPDSVHPGDVPVFSRAAWSIPPPPAGAQYYARGNAHFLSARLRIAGDRLLRETERDAVRFFAQRFGVDFAGARTDPETGARRHPSLPAVLEPYTAAAGRLQYAEGHLSSPERPRNPAAADPLGNGLLAYGARDEGGVAEVGWMLRPTSREGLPLRRQGDAKDEVRLAEVRLPKGAMLSTGFWVVDRPGAPPALLRFQSSSPPRVRSLGAAQGGVEVTSRYDVYDMGHNAALWPAKGVGRAVSTIRRNRTGRHRSRTSVTVHH